MPSNMPPRTMSTVWRERRTRYAGKPAARPVRYMPGLTYADVIKDYPTEGHLTFVLQLGFAPGVVHTSPGMEITARNSLLIITYRP